MPIIIPTMEQYKEILSNIADDIRTTVAVRLGAEAGLGRKEIVFALSRDLDRYHTRGLWIETAKKIKKGSEYKMRSREVPINRSLYPLLRSYISNHGDTPYILHKNKPKEPTAHTPRNINKIYEKAKIPWPPYGSRHFFRAQIRLWMIRNRRIDMQVIKEMMGHHLTVSEGYGGQSPFEYKLEIVDAVFG